MKHLGVRAACKFANSQAITTDMLDELINNFMTVPYRTEDPASIRYQERCWHLFKRDYEIGEVNNSDGSLCAHYPPTILIPEQEVTAKSREERKGQMDPVADYKRRSECIIDSRNGSSGESASRELSGWVHIDSDGGQYTKSLDTSVQPELAEFGGFTILDTNTNSTEDNKHNGVAQPESEVSIDSIPNQYPLVLVNTDKATHSEYPSQC